MAVRLEGALAACARRCVLGWASREPGVTLLILCAHTVCVCVCVLRGRSVSDAERMIESKDALLARWKEEATMVRRGACECGAIDPAAPRHAPIGASA